MDLQEQLKDKQLAYDGLRASAESTEKALGDAQGVITQLRSELARAQKRKELRQEQSQSKVRGLGDSCALTVPQGQLDSSSKLRAALQEQREQARVCCENGQCTS